MSVMKRMRDISVATLNDKLERSEDPIRLIDQYLISQKGQIAQAENLYQQCKQHTQKMKHQYLSAESIVQKREEQARLAVQAGEEQLARLALQEKVAYEEKSNQYKQLYEQGQQSVDELEYQLQQLKADVDEVQAKRQFYMARIESIRLQRRMNERTGAASGYGSTRIFHRLEDKVNDMELETRSLREVRQMDSDPWTQLGRDIKDTVEQELLSLKQKLQEEGWMKR